MTLPEYAELVNGELERLLPEQNQSPVPMFDSIPETLASAMRYSLLSGGKRLRPAMLLATVEMLGGSIDEALTYACAIEMIHCSSLIHDDLPGMDNDVLRRGKPTNHVVFGEGQAILAGDGLLSMAFETMLQAALNHPEHLLRHVQAMSEIGRGAGVKGMMAGQSHDLLLEKTPNATLSDLRFIQTNKTSALFVYAMRAAARLCGATDAQLTALEKYALSFGLLFQTIDDLLDEVGDEQQLGKSVGKDKQSGKLTAVSLYGLGGAIELKEQFLSDGMFALVEFGPEADFFRNLIRETASRTA